MATVPAPERLGRLAGDRPMKTWLVRWRVTALPHVQRSPATPASPWLLDIEGIRYLRVRAATLSCDGSGPREPTRSWCREEPGVTFLDQARVGKSGEG